MQSWDGHPSSLWAHCDDAHAADADGRYGGPGHSVGGRDALGVFAVREAVGDIPLHPLTSPCIPLHRCGRWWATRSWG